MGDIVVPQASDALAIQLVSGQPDWKPVGHAPCMTKSQAWGVIEGSSSGLCPKTPSNLAPALGRYRKRIAGAHTYWIWSFSRNLWTYTLNLKQNLEIAWELSIESADALWYPDCWIPRTTYSMSSYLFSTPWCASPPHQSLKCTEVSNFFLFFSRSALPLWDKAVIFNPVHLMAHCQGTKIARATYAFWTFEQHTILLVGSSNSQLPYKSEPQTPRAHLRTICGTPMYNSALVENQLIWKL